MLDKQKEQNEDIRFIKRTCKLQSSDIQNHAMYINKVAPMKQYSMIVNMLHKVLNSKNDLANLRVLTDEYRHKMINLFNLKSYIKSVKGQHYDHEEYHAHESKKDHHAHLLHKSGRLDLIKKYFSQLSPEAQDTLADPNEYTQRMLQADSTNFDESIKHMERLISQIMKAEVILKDKFSKINENEDDILKKMETLEFQFNIEETKKSREGNLMS